MALGVFAAGEDDEVEGELGERSAAYGPELGADALLGRFELLTHQACVTIALAFCAHFVLIAARSHAGGLNHAFPGDREARVCVVVAQPQKLSVREPSFGFQRSFAQVLVFGFRCCGGVCGYAVQVCR